MSFSASGPGATGASGASSSTAGMSSPIPPSQAHGSGAQQGSEMPPPGSENPTAKAKGKRRMSRDPSPPDPDDTESHVPPTKKPRAAPTKPAMVSARKKQSPTDHHVKEEHIPKAAGATKRALILHIRILWRLYHQAEMPPEVTKDMKQRFDDRYNTEAEVSASVRAAIEDKSTSAALDNISREVRELKAKLLSTSRSMISDNIREVADEWIVEAYKDVARVGLTRWAPDVFDSPDSIYNKLHEHIALETFRVLVGAGAYRLKGASAGFANKLSLLGAIYRSFVFSHIRDKAKAEKEQPGSAKKEARMTNVYKRRARLRDNRMEVLSAQSFDTVVMSLANETEAHSDDEYLSDAEGGEVYRIHEKEQRSGKVKTFFRMLDQQYERMMKNKGKRRGSRDTRKREDPPTGTAIEPSQIPTLPKSVPIDWFDPDFWNNTLTVRERAEIIKDGKRIALPRVEHCQTMEQCRKWKNLSADEFWEQYGRHVLEQYVMPTEKELELLKMGDWEEEEEEEEEEEVQGEQGPSEEDAEMS